MDPVKNKILVVEDDEIIRKVIVWRLNRLGYTICGEVFNRSGCDQTL